MRKYLDLFTLNFRNLIDSWQSQPSLTLLPSMSLESAAATGTSNGKFKLFEDQG